MARRGLGICFARQLEKVAGISMVGVPFKGTGPALQEVVASRLELTVSPLALALPQHEAGTVKIAGFNAPIVRWSPTAIRVLAPLTGSYPTRGPVTVETGGQTITGPEFTVDPNAPQPQPPLFG